MEIDLYNINNKNSSLDLVEEEFKKFKNLSGYINDKSGKKFIQLSNIYKNSYNLLAKDILINKLKINEIKAKEIHRAAWDSLLKNKLDSFDRHFVQTYLVIINDLALNYIDTYLIDHDKLLLDNLNQNSEEEVTKRWTFVWKFISEKDELGKKIFLYKLLAGLSFENISEILKTDEQKIKNKYFEVESELFDSEDFKIYFKIK